MNIEELKAINPELNAVELKEGARYLICIEKRMPMEVMDKLSEQFRKMAEHNGITIAAVINFVPVIFELKADQ